MLTSEKSFESIQNQLNKAKTNKITMVLTNLLASCDIFGIKNYSDVEVVRNLLATDFQLWTLFRLQTLSTMNSMKHALPLWGPKNIYIFICICVSTDSTFMEFIPFVVVPNVYINWLVYKNTFGNPISILSQGSRGDNFFHFRFQGKGFICFHIPVKKHVLELRKSMVTSGKKPYESFQNQSKQSWNWKKPKLCSF